MPKNVWDRSSSTPGAGCRLFVWLDTLEEAHRSWTRSLHFVWLKDIIKDKVSYIIEPNNLTGWSSENSRNNKILK